MTMIEVYADIWCPFTHVGLTRVVARRAEIGATQTLRVRAWPLELVNGAPMDAGFIGAEIDDIRAQIAPELFTGFCPDTFPATTLPALALAEAAYGVGAAEGESMSLALRRSLFEEGLDVSDPDVLSNLAAAHGVPMPGGAELEAVESSLREGRERGVVGSPHFFTPDGGFFCPALDISKVDGHLRIAADLPAFEAFVDSCFAA